MVPGSFLKEDRLWVTGSLKGEETYVIRWIMESVNETALVCRELYP